MRLPSLTALRAFEAAARLGGVTRAAEELHVTQSAVSRQIRGLESELCVALFRRVHRGVVLSPEGESLAMTLRDAFTRIADGVDKLRRDPNSVKVRVPPTFGVRWLWPRLRRFEAAHPEIELHVSILWRAVEPGDRDHDLGIRTYVSSWPRAAAVELFQERLCPVCTPDFLARVAQRVDRPDFRHLALLHCTNHEDWRRWAEQWPGPPFEIARGPVFDTLDLALRAAEDGRGVAMTDLAMAEADIASGRLTVLAPQMVVSGETYFLMTPEGATERPAVAKFRAWLLDEVARFRASSLESLEPALTPAQP